MKRIAAASLALVLLASAFGWTAPALAKDEEKKKEELKSPIERISYAIGTRVGMSLKASPDQLDLTAFLRGVEDSLKGNGPLLSEEEVTKLNEEFTARIREAMTIKRKEEAKKNLKEGKAFLAKNGKKKGVVTTDSGLQYLVLKKGDGPKPKATDQVTVHYKGTLLDGTEFDSSLNRGKPMTRAANRLIAGWTEALQLMSVGSKYRLFIPPDLAYKERGMGPKIGPNSTLIFEVELLEIK